MSNQPIIDPEFKDLIPPLTEEEYQQLEQNILACRRCNDAILLWEGIIVDGFNRFCICVTHGIEMKYEEVDFLSREDAKVWMLENQLGRRNLCDAARIELALCKAELLREKAKKNQSCAGGDKKSAESLFTKSSKLTPEEVVNVEKAIAKDAGVGQGTLQRYTQIKESNRPELLEKVQSGAMKIGTAHRLISPNPTHEDPIQEIEKRLKQADKMYAYIKERVPFEDESANHELHTRMGQLTEKLTTMINALERGAICTEN